MAVGRLAGAAAIGVEAGKVISKYKAGKHFDLTITETSLTVTRRQDRIDAEAALDGFYVLRTPVPAARLDAPAVVTAYKNLARVERDFRSIKFDDLDLRPVFHPVAPARRSAAAQAKASAQQDAAGRHYRSFRGLLEDLALTRNQVRFTGTGAITDMLTEPTSTQRQAFDLIGVPIPLTLK